jgi:histone H3/H4
MERNAERDDADSFVQQWMNTRKAELERILKYALEAQARITSDIVQELNDRIQNFNVASGKKPDTR